MNIIDKLTEGQLNPNVPEFRVGDTVKVGVKIIERGVKDKKGKDAGPRERVQWFEGLVVSRKGSKVSETFTVRKISYGVGVERTFPVHSPNITEIKVVKKGKVRRAKLYNAKNVVGLLKTKERN